MKNLFLNLIFMAVPKIEILKMYDYLQEIFHASFENNHAGGLVYIQDKIPHLMLELEKLGGFNKFLVELDKITPEELVVYFEK